MLVGVAPRDFGGDHPLAGMGIAAPHRAGAYAFSGSLKAPCQRVGDLLEGRPSTHFGGVTPTYRPGVALGDLRSCLPDFIIQNLCLALPKLGQRLSGFDCPDALLTGPETRSSAPVRLLRNARRESPIAGLYPLAMARATRGASCPPLWTAVRRYGDSLRGLMNKQEGLP